MLEYIDKMESLKRIELELQMLYKKISLVEGSNELETSIQANSLIQVGNLIDAVDELIKLFGVEWEDEE